MKSEEELVEWARTHAAWLRNAGRNQTQGMSYPRQARHLATKALEFLQAQAPGSHFLRAADESFEIDASEPYMACDATAAALEAWADYVEEGLAIAAPFESRARAEAATDLMEQVQLLLDDPHVHHAAPVMLAGAALEEFLRSMMVDCSEEVVGEPSISKYADALRRCDVLTKQEVKDITAWAGRRNDAAHGHFDAFDLLSARHMVEGVNLFMQRRAGAEPLSGG